MLFRSFLLLTTTDGLLALKRFTETKFNLANYQKITIGKSNFIGNTPAKEDHFVTEKVLLLKLAQ